MISSYSKGLNVALGYFELNESAKRKVVLLNVSLYNCISQDKGSFKVLSCWREVPGCYCQPQATTAVPLLTLRRAGKLKSHPLDPVQGSMERQLWGHPHSLKCISKLLRYFSNIFFNASVFVVLWTAIWFLDFIIVFPDQLWNAACCQTDGDSCGALHAGWASGYSFAWYLLKWQGSYFRIVSHLGRVFTVVRKAQKHLETDNGIVFVDKYFLFQ